MKIGMVVAFEKNRGIGRDGKIVWHFPYDAEYFRTITTSHIVIFGRRTYEEIASPLPNRINIIVSTTKTFEGQNLYTVKSLPEAIELGKKLAESRREAQNFLSPDPIIFLCGGERIYKEGMPLANVIFTTRIDASYPCDAFFPQIDERLFTEVSRSTKSQNGIKLEFITYARCD